MKRVSTVELLRNFGVYGDVALAEPVILTKNGRDRLVLLSVEKYETLEQSRQKMPNERSKAARGDTAGRRKG
jgi:prevent-host-death family protein